MSSEVNIRESPNHFIVLDAISRGVSSVDKISKVSKLSKTEIELVVNDLVVQRLITSNEKRGFLGRKKIELKITETGMDLLGNKKNELKDKVQEMQQYYDNGNRTQLESLMDSNRAWMPMMLFSGLMNILFTSMMSLMGMAMILWKALLPVVVKAGMRTVDLQQRVKAVLIVLALIPRQELILADLMVADLMVADLMVADLTFSHSSTISSN